MKEGIHPENYRLVAFKDMSNGMTTLTKSTAVTKETIEIDGVEYPLVKLEISNTSHPFYTGKVKLVDTAGRVDKFMNRYKTHMETERNNFFIPHNKKPLSRRFFIFLRQNAFFSHKKHVPAPRCCFWHRNCLT